SRGFAGFFNSPILWGGLMTCGFYSLVPHLPVYGDIALRYLCGRPMEYATTAMFFMAVAILIGKGLALMAERTALSSDVLPHPSSAGSREIITGATSRARQPRAMPPP